MSDDRESILIDAVKYRKLVAALSFSHNIATEELPHVTVGTGAEVALRHIKRKTGEALRAAGIETEG